MDEAKHMPLSEQIFLNEMADKNKTYLHQPETFVLNSGTFKHKYRPDFYCVEDDTYIEIVLHSCQEDKYRLFRENYPNHTLEVIYLDKKKYATKRELKEGFADKSIRDVPVVLWYEFVGHCKTNGKTVTQGIIEAVTLWMNKEG